MNATYLIVCQRSGSWASALLRHLQPTTRLRNARGAADCNAILAVAPYSAVALEVSRESLGSALELLARFCRDYPHAALLVLAARGLEEYELALREAGALHVVFSMGRAAEVARLAERHIAQAPAPHVSYAAQVLQSLPWPDRAASP